MRVVVGGDRVPVARPGRRQRGPGAGAQLAGRTRRHAVRGPESLVKPVSERAARRDPRGRGALR